MYNRKSILEKPWSKYQRDVFSELNEPKNILVNAVAGSGKTTTIEGIVAHLPPSEKVRVIAFNKHIADELTERLPKKTSVSTAHKAGLGMICHLFGKGIKPDDRKYRDIIGKLLKGVLSSLPTKGKQQDALIKIECNYFLSTATRMLMVNLLEPSEENINWVLKEYSIEIENVPDEVIECLPKILDEGERLAHQEIIGLEDLLWIPNIWELETSHYDFLLVDECQDANMAQIGIWSKYVSAGAKIIMFGDPHQAIYGFAGSSTQAWEIMKTKFNPVEMPLSVCYRCPKSHIEIAKKIVPQITWAEGAKEGITEKICHHKALDMAGAKDLFLCRFTAPLVKFCFELIAEQKKAKVRGKDIGVSLASLARKITENVYTLASDAKDFLTEQQHKLEADAFEATKDKVEAILIIYENSRVRSIEELCQKIMDIFADENESIMLSTVHRAKGDQAERVFILCPEKMPFIEKAKTKWQVEQEYNLLYVALTRSKNELYFIKSP